jgi:adenosylcobyric acid synthase
MSAVEYFAYKDVLVKDIMGAFETLAGQHDVIVIEGAGSPAEINLKRNDIVNMGLAKMTDSPVLLVGDIDCGGVFAQIVGTLELLEDDEKNRVKGVIINKFRGDMEILKPGIVMLEERIKKPVVGVVPYLDVIIEDEDSLVRGTPKNPEVTEGLNSLSYRQKQYDMLAAALREHLDMEFIYELLGV